MVWFKFAGTIVDAFKDVSSRFSKTGIVMEYDLNKYLKINPTNNFDEQLVVIQAKVGAEKAKLQSAKEHLQSTKKELKFLESTLSSLLPIEQSTYMQKHADIETILAKQQSDAENMSKTIKSGYRSQEKILDYKMLSKKYLEIDLKFLSMPKEQQFGITDVVVLERSGRETKLKDICVKLPQFAVIQYSSYEPTMIVEYTIGMIDATDIRNCKFLDVNVGAGSQFWHKYPKNISLELAESLDKGSDYKSPEYTHLGFVCGFQGIIPKDIKKKINTAKKDFQNDQIAKYSPNHIFIICEARNWTIANKRDSGGSWVIPRPIVEPTQSYLVVGIKHDKAYLIDTYNQHKRTKR